MTTDRQNARSLKIAIRDAIETAAAILPPEFRDELASLRLAVDCYRLANDSLTAENAKLRNALAVLRAWPRLYRTPAFIRVIEQALDKKSGAP